MPKLKHSKFKNTGILFELLVRQITAEVLSGNMSTADKIIKKHFSKGSQLIKELEMYRTLVEKKFKNEGKAKELIEAVVKVRNSLSNSKLKKEKYNLISEIKESYDIEDFFKSKIPDYKLLASIYKLFEETAENNISPHEKIQSKYTIVEHVTGSDAQLIQEHKQAEMEVLKRESKEMKFLAYKIMVEKFNNKYKVLSGPQKNLLKQYINNISNTNSFREYVNKSVDGIKTELNELNRTVMDEVTRIKIVEIMKQADNLKHGQVVKENQILSLMRYYHLVDKLKETIQKESENED